MVGGILKVFCAVCIALCAGLAAPDARAQMPLGTTGASEDRIEVPERLTPEIVDSMVARLDDGQIRALLLQELQRRAEEQSRDGAGETALASIEARLSGMAANIQERTSRWAVAIANLGERRGQVSARLAQASYGVAGMLAAAAVLVAAGLFAAWFVAALLRRWRGWLLAADDAGYWDRVVRMAALFVLEIAPILAFVAATRLVAPFLSDALGPLNAQVWIYYIGIAWGWAFIVMARRAFAPDAPQIRVAPLQDDAASGLHRLIRHSVLIGTAGWVAAGFFPTLGFGFPPALVTVALAGSVVAGSLFYALIRNFNGIREAILQADASGAPGATMRIAAAAAPVLLGLYLVFAWLYWLAHWLDRGQHRLDGPVGTLIVLLLLPIADRLGAELIGSFIRHDTARAERFRNVLQGAWRIVTGFAAVLVIAGMWGLDLLSLAKGEQAPVWASAAFDIVVTLLIGYLIWRLIAAALYTERFVSEAAEDAGPDTVEASRLDTLTPLFRNMLLGFLLVIVAMIVLSALGVDIGPLIASAGIVGIAIGFGAQALVRDVFSGIFFLIDDAFRVGEYIELDPETRGEVEAISVRSLQLRNHRGPVITIPFGELKKIVNHNRDWVIYKMPFRLEPDTDPQHVKKVVKRVGAEFMEHPLHGPKFIEPLKSQGVFAIDDDSALVIRVKFKCLPRAQFVLRREIYHRLRAVFAEEGIRFARRKVEVVGADGEPADPAAAASAADDLAAASAPQAL